MSICDIKSDEWFAYFKGLLIKDNQPDPEFKKKT